MSLATQIRSLSPAAWWRLDDAPSSLIAADSSGNGHDAGFGTYFTGSWVKSGAVTLVGSPGDPGPSVQVPGTVGVFTYIDTGVTPAHIEIDLYTTVLGDFFFGCNSSGAGQMVRVDTRNGTFCALATTSSWTSWSTPASGLGPVSANSWHHLDITIAGATATLKIDGATANSIPYSADGSFIGYVGDGGGGYTYFCNLLINGSSIVTFGEPPPPGFSVTRCAQMNEGSTVFRSSLALRATFATSIDTSFSVIALLKSPGTGVAGFVSSRSQFDQSFELRTSGGNSIEVLVGNGSAWIETSFSASVASINDGNWHMVLVAVNATGLTLYVDGVNVGATTWAAAVPLLVDSNHDLMIGVGLTPPVPDWETYPGYLSDVAIFPSTLTAAQSADLYDAWADSGPFLPLL